MHESVIRFCIVQEQPLSEHEYAVESALKYILSRLDDLTDTVNKLVAKDPVAREKAKYGLPQYTADQVAANKADWQRKFGKKRKAEDC